MTYIYPLEKLMTSEVDHEQFKEWSSIAIVERLEALVQAIDRNTEAIYNTGLSEPIQTWRCGHCKTDNIRKLHPAKCAHCGTAIGGQ